MISGRKLILFAVGSSVFFLLGVRSFAQYNDGIVPVIPAPAMVVVGSGTHILQQDVPIFTDTLFLAEAQALGRLLGSPEQPITMLRTTEREHQRGVLLRFDSTVRHEEGYRLTIDSLAIEISARTAAGCFYGVQTLRQLLPAVVERVGLTGTHRLRKMYIDDSPRFAWRAGMLDCSRHIFSVPFIKEYISNLALLKLNRFHWHLTDDQGWRIQILSQPALTTVGAYRERGGTVYGGFYTQDEVREIVEHARGLHVTVVPEIDMPGHSSAALAAYPMLHCSDTAITVSSEWGIHENVMCVGQEETYVFVRNVLSEIAALFPSPWIHVGGDECPIQQWRTHDRCREQVVASGMNNIGELQSYFTARVSGILDSLGKQAIGWNEVLRGGAPRDMIVQWWYGPERFDEVADAGNRVIMSPHLHCYLDYEYAVLPLRAAYAFNPYAYAQADSTRERILGVAANLWTESCQDDASAVKKIYPRIAAIAEVGWSLPGRMDYAGFCSRLGVLGGRWSMMGQFYYRDSEILWDDGELLTVTSSSGPDHGTFTFRLSHERSTEKSSGDFMLLCNDLHWTPIAGGMTAADIVYVHLDREQLRSAVKLQLRDFDKRSNPWAAIADPAAANGLYGKKLLGLQGSLETHAIFPNPVSRGSTSSVQLILEGVKSTDVQISVCDRLGRTAAHATKTMRIEGGQLLVTVDVSSLSPGTYFIRTVSGNVQHLGGFQLIR